MKLSQVPTAEDLADLGFKPLDGKAKALPGIVVQAKDDDRLYYRVPPADSQEWFLFVRRWIRLTRQALVSRPAV